MLSITLGFKENGRTAEPTVLYAGNDADKARAALENPPAGFIRTGMVRNPIVNPNRQFPDNIATAEAPKATAPRQSKPKDPAPPAED